MQPGDRLGHHSGLAIANIGRVNGAIESARPFLESKQQVVIFDRPSTVHAKVDATRIARIIGNLLTTQVISAFAYSRDNGAHVGNFSAELDLIPSGGSLCPSRDRAVRDRGPRPWAAQRVADDVGEGADDAVRASKAKSGNLREGVDFN